jgi:hypothetical protein
MPLHRVAFPVGVLLLVGAFVLPCLSWLDLSAASLPYQDVSPDLAQKQAADMAALDRELGIRLWIGAAMAFLGLTALGYALGTRSRYAT